VNQEGKGFGGVSVAWGGGGNFIKLSLQYFHSWRGWVRLEEGGMWNQNKVRNVTEVVG